MTSPISTDVMVLGAGPGGYAAALRVASLGKKVALVHKKGGIGGVCLQQGCIAAKALLYATSQYAHLADLKKMGITANAKIRYDALQGWKSSVISSLENGIKMLCDNRKVQLIQGMGSFIGPKTLKVGNKTLRFKDAIIATGSSPIEIPAFPFSHTHVLDSADALSLPALPKSLLIVGGGYVGLQVATIFSRLGCKVTIVEMEKQLLPGFGPRVSRMILDNLAKMGVVIKTTTTARRMVKSTARDVTVDLQGDGRGSSVTAEKMLIAVGRRPNSRGAGLDKLGLKLDAHGFVKVDASQKTSVPNVYAVGDVSDPQMLAHTATAQGMVAADNICGRPSRYDGSVIPMVIDTDPVVVSVGLSPALAREKGLDVVTSKSMLAMSGAARTHGSAAGFVQWVADKKTKKLLGMQAAGHGINDLAGEASLAITKGLTAADVGRTIHAHPTLGESLMDAAQALLGESIHSFEL